MSKRFAIGIDGGKKTGFAVWERKKKKFIDVTSSDFWDVFNSILGKFTANECVIYVEDPSQNKPVFFKKGVTNAKSLSRVAQNVGGVKRESELLIEGLELEGYEVVRIRPQKGSMTKLKAEAFSKFTGYEGKTNEHGRDAAMLVFGR